MPLTLSFEGYMIMMAKKGEPEDEARKDFARIERVKAAVLSASAASGSGSAPMGMFGGCTVGAKCCWWDYGQLPLFTGSMALLRSEGEEASLYRRFLGIGARIDDATQLGSCSVVDGSSVVQGSKFNSGTIDDSVVCNVYVSMLLLHRST